jgi:hypothetical protein
LNDGPLRLDCLNAAQIADTLTVDATSTASSCPANASKIRQSVNP